MAVPLSRGAALARVLSGFYEQEWGKERQVKAEAKVKEDEARRRRFARGDALYEKQLGLGKEKALRLYEAELAGKAKPTAKDVAYTDYLKAQAEDVRGKSSQRFQEMESKLGQAYGEIDFMRKQHKLEKMLYDIDKRQLKEKYGGGAGGKGGLKGNERDVLENLRALEERLLRMRITAKEMDDKNEMAYVNEQLNAVRQRLQFFEKLDPVNQAFEQMSFMGPGSEGMGKGIGTDYVDTGTSSGEPGTLGKILEAGKKFFDKTGERPGKPEVPELLQDVQKVDKPKDWFFRTAPWSRVGRKAREEDLDYLLYLASTGNPLYVKMLYDEAMKDERNRWYFEGRER